jgi:nucleoid-associated protein YejK
LTAIEAQIAHAIRKRNNAEKIKETVKKDLKNKEDSIARMTKDLEDVQKASDAAQGVFLRDVV